MAIVVVVIFAAVVVSRRDDSGASGNAAAAFEEIVNLAVSGQFGRLYDVLHPAQQAIIDRDDYIACARQEVEDNPLWGGVAVEVTETYPETIEVPGTDQHVEVTALVVRFEVMGQTTTATEYLANVNETWRWFEDEPQNYQPSTDPFESSSCAG